MIITISADIASPEIVDVFHNGESFQKLKLPRAQQTPDAEHFEQDIELGDDDVPDSYGPVPDLKLPKGFFALAAYRRGKFLFILVGGPNFLEKFGNPVLAARAVASVVASIEEGGKEAVTQRASPETKPFRG